MSRHRCLGPRTAFRGRGVETLGRNGEGIRGRPQPEGRALRSQRERRGKPFRSALLESALATDVALAAGISRIPAPPAAEAKPWIAAAKSVKAKP